MKIHLNIWVVIVTFNAEEWIDQCLQSLRKSTLKANVVIVDNHSVDNTISILKEKYPECKTIVNVRNEGFGVGNNKGISYALRNGADYVGLLNQDAKLNTDTLEKLWQFAEKYPEYGILAPLFYSYDGSKLDVYLVKSVFAHDLSLASDIFFNRAKEVYEVGLAPAAMWFIRRQALQEAGGFDPLFFMYGEDDDLWRRFKVKGWKTGFFPQTFVYHHTPENSFSIKKRIWSSYAISINLLKNYKRAYLKNVFYFFKDYFKNSLNAVLDLNKSELYVLQITFFKTVPRLFTVYKNRKKSFQGNMPFLNV